jgi:hypothetical protein
MFLGKSAHSAGICTPPDTLDHEVEGNLDKENMTSLLPIKTITCRSASDAKEVREGVAQYCKTRGHTSWQDIHKLILNHAQLLTWFVSVYKEGHAVVDKPSAFVNVIYICKIQFSYLLSLYIINNM